MGGLRQLVQVSFVGTVDAAVDLTVLVQVGVAERVNLRTRQDHRAVFGVLRRYLRALVQNVLLQLQFRVLTASLL